MTPSNKTVFLWLLSTNRAFPIRVSHFHLSIGRAQKSTFVVNDYLAWQHALVVLIQRLKWSIPLLTVAYCCRRPCHICRSYGIWSSMPQNRLETVVKPVHSATCNFFFV